jgi:hypothetical protein
MGKACIDCGAAMFNAKNAQKRCVKCGKQYRQPYMREYHKQRKEREAALIKRLKEEIMKLEEQIAMQGGK